MAADFHQQVGEAEAVVPEVQHLAAGGSDDRVKQRATETRGLHADVDHPQWRANLHSRDAPAIAMGQAEGCQRVSQISDEGLRRRGSDVVHRLRFFKQQRVAKLENGANGHGKAT